MTRRIAVVAPVSVHVLVLLGGGLFRQQGAGPGFGVNQVGMLAALKERPTPDFSVTGFDGRPLRLADRRGQAVVLNFWASWCPPCRAEARDLERVAQAYRDRGVVFLGVNVQDAEPDARAFLKEFGVTYPSVRDATNGIAFSYAPSGLPSTYFIDREGRVVSRRVGLITEQQLVAQVEELRR